MIKKIILFLFEYSLHLLAIIIIVYTFLPLAKWYYYAKPLWGVDFFYTAAIENLIKSNLVFPPQAWGYAWFTGWPVLSNYPILHYYLILPFTYFFDLISSIKIWMLISLSLYFIGVYACFYKICKNRIFSILLSIATIYSVGVYGTLMWGGSLSSHATQAFFPWVVFFIIAYLKHNSTKYLLTAALITGLAILGHPQVAIGYIYPTAAVLFITWFGSIKFLDRVKSFVTYIIISFFIALPLIYSSMGGALSSLVVTNANKVALSTVKLPSQTELDIMAFNKAQPLRIFTDTNTTIFFLLTIAFVFFLAVLILRTSKKRLLEVIPIIFLTIYFIVYIWIFAYGISIYHGGWYRLFWTTPFWLGLLAASFWGYAHNVLYDKLTEIKWHIKGLFLLISILLLGVGSYLLIYFSANIKEKIVPRSTESSAYPDVLSLRTNPEGVERLKKELVPEWLNPQKTDVRLYTADQTINIWWNYLYTMPLARGYFDPPLFHGYTFWLDASLSQDSQTGEDQLVSSFKYPPKIAFNNTLFLINWYAIKFLEAGPSNATYTSFPKELNNDTYIVHDQELDFNKEKFTKGNQILHFYELQDKYSSEILSATNVPTIGIVATDSGYETIIRALADMNLSSNQLIPIKLGKYLDQLSAAELNAMDALIIYDYDYKNRGNAFRLISDYSKKGRKIFIDTGGEVKDSENIGPLPDVFPFESTYRKPLGKNWDFEILDNSLTKDVDFSKFDPPIFNDAEWKLSYPRDTANLKAGTTIILKNHGIPLMISQKFESGEIIWSGLNFPYHVIRYHNESEVTFFKNIVKKLLEGSNMSSEPAFESKFLSPQKREITTQSKSKGVLFKEEAFDGWIASVDLKGQTRSLNIFKAGPAYPGFMYVRLPEDLPSNTVIFQYNGSKTAWLVSLLACIIFILVIDEIIFGDKVLGKLRRMIWRNFQVRLTGWWGKEDE